MLTFDLWVATGRSFTDIAMPGEEVDKAIVDYFINVIMPASLQAGYVQMGEPHSFFVRTKMASGVKHTSPFLKTRAANGFTTGHVLGVKRNVVYETSSTSKSMSNMP